MVHIDWVMPRYLNKGHMQTLVDRMIDWEDTMKNTIDMMQDGGDELLQK